MPLIRRKAPAFIWYDSRNAITGILSSSAREIGGAGLIKLALEDLYRKHNAKRVFGD